MAAMTIRELGRLLRSRQTSAVALAEQALERLATQGKALNAVATLTRDLALEQARQADRELAAGRDRGPLHGIPYGAKDLLSTPGIPTSWGAPPLAEQVLEGEASVVRRLREAGAVLVAKLAMVEIAGGLGYEQADAAHTGPGLNPWNPRRWAGGSSSGSGAAVAAGCVPFAIGTETSGSIVTPAAYCGVTGLRPTYGLVSRHGGMALCWSLDRLGPLARTADDCGLILQVIAGADPADDTTVPHGYQHPPLDEPARPFKLAVLKESVTMQPEVSANFQQSLELLRPRATIEEIELPQLPYGAVVGTIIDCESAAAFEPLLNDGRVWEMRAPEDRIGIHAEQFIPAKDYINAQRIRRIIQREIDRLLAPFDALVMPARATVAPPIDRPFSEYQRPWRHSVFSGAEAAAGIPSITLPNGFGEEGLPTALHLVGRAFNEQILVRLAHDYQSLSDWHRRQPAAL